MRRENRELAPLGNGPSLWPKKTAGREKFTYRRGEKVSLGKREVFLDGADRRGLGGEPIAGSLLAARRGGSRFQNGTCSREDAGRALIGNFLFGF